MPSSKGYGRGKATLAVIPHWSRLLFSELVSIGKEGTVANPEGATRLYLELP